LNHLHVQAYCRTCPDRRRVQRAIDEAKQIRHCLEELMEHQNCVSSQVHVPKARYFHTPVRCRMSGWTCQRIGEFEWKLRLAEQELEQVFATLCNYLESLDSTGSKSLRHKAFELLRGHYPSAASFIKR